METEVAVPEESAEWARYGVEAPATEEAPESTEVQETETPEVAPAEDAAPEPKKSVQQRINEITRKYREEERERQRLANEAEYWKTKAMSGGQTPPPQTYQPTGRPQVSDFDTQEAYEDSLLDWNYRRTIAETQAQSAQIHAQEVQEKARKTFEKNAAKVRAEHDDFDDVIENPVFSREMHEALLETDDGPEVAYFLGRFENHDRAEQIRSLSPAAQIYALGQLGHELKLNKKLKKTTAAPAPITPVGMAGAPPVDSSKLSMEQWHERERARELAKIKEKYS